MCIHAEISKVRLFTNQSFNLKSLLTAPPTVALIANKKFPKFPPNPDFPFPDKFVNKCFKLC